MSAAPAIALGARIEYRYAPYGWHAGVVVDITDVWSRTEGTSRWATVRCDSGHVHHVDLGRATVRVIQP